MSGIRAAARAPRRVFLGLAEVAGYYANLRAGFEELGVRATFVDLGAHPFDYGGASELLLVRATRRVFRARLAAASAGGVRRVALQLAEAALRLALFAWALARFDAFVFGFGTSFLWQSAFEFRVLRWLGKRTVCVYHGSDSRPPYLDGALMACDAGRSIVDCVRLTRRTKDRVARVDRWADWVVDHPMAAHFHERPVVQWLAMGIPSRRAAASDAPLAAPAARAVVRILHSPSHPEAKGTARIHEAIERVRGRGVAIELVQIVARPHADVQTELARCDFVVDQLYSDTPMAGFATEAAHHGRPAVVSGYAGEDLAVVRPPESWPPTLYCHPDEVEDAIHRLATDAGLRRELGERARDFVTGAWAPRRVAERFVRLFADDVPPEWLFDPREVRYVFGGALPEARSRELIAAVVATAGESALQLDDKPALREALLRHARETVREPMAVGC